MPDSILFYVIVGTVQGITAGGSGTLKEYCQLETLHAKCPEWSVVSMREARYGRMHLGRCVQRDYGYLKCQTDALSYLDQACSGRWSCDFAVADLHGSQPCPGDLTPFLEASYECILGTYIAQLLVYPGYVYIPAMRVFPARAQPLGSLGVRTPLNF